MRVYDESDLGQIKLQVSEVEAIEWWSVDKVENEMKKQESKQGYWSRKAVPGEIVPASYFVFNRLSKLRYF